MKSDSEEMDVSDDSKVAGVEVKILSEKVSVREQTFKIVLLQYDFKYQFQFFFKLNYNAWLFKRMDRYFLLLYK